MTLPAPSGPTPEVEFLEAPQALTAAETLSVPGG